MHNKEEDKFYTVHVRIVICISSANQVGDISLFDLVIKQNEGTKFHFLLTLLGGGGVAVVVENES